MYKVKEEPIEQLDDNLFDLLNLTNVEYNAINGGGGAHAVAVGVVDDDSIRNQRFCIDDLINNTFDDIDFSVHDKRAANLTFKFDEQQFSIENIFNKFPFSSSHDDLNTTTTTINNNNDHQLNYYNHTNNYNYHTDATSMSNNDISNHHNMINNSFHGSHNNNNNNNNYSSFNNNSNKNMNQFTSLEQPPPPPPSLPTTTIITKQTIQPTNIKQSKSKQLKQKRQAKRQKYIKEYENECKTKEVFNFEFMKIEQEENTLNKLNKLFNEADYDDNCVINSNDLTRKYKCALARYRCKLNLRKLKRIKRLKVFDIDSLVNELIDSEKARNKINLESQQQQSNDSTTTTLAATQTTSSTTASSNDVEIIAVTRVLDRFNLPKRRNQHFDYNTIGLVEFRNDDIKCIISPYTNRPLKPYIRRDYESWPTRIKLNKELYDRCSLNINNCLQGTKFQRYSIDYVYLRPEHVMTINYLCKKYFWNGIDVSECLQYPDYTIVALYHKLIIGFAFVVPNSSFNEDYLSFIFVHPHWRLSGIAKYMLYRLALINTRNDLTLHVSVNSDAVLFYQKFGFKIEEYVKQFYDKYYSYEEHDYLSKDAFFMRLAR